MYACTFTLVLLFYGPFQAVGYESREVEAHTYKLKYESKGKLSVKLSEFSMTSQHVFVVKY